MAACHILQTEIYPSQLVDDNLTLSNAPTAATLEEDLNYIRSVLKALHGGSNWYDVGTGVQDLLTDFPVEHYTTTENPVLAGRHKDVNADSLTTPTINLSGTLTWTSQGYKIVDSNVGPDGQASGTSLVITGPDGAVGSETGIVISGETSYLSSVKIKSTRLDFETDSGSLDITTDAATGAFLRIGSTSIDKNFEVTLSDAELGVYPKVGTNYQAGALFYSYSIDAWHTQRFWARALDEATLTSNTHAGEFGRIASSTGGVKIGGRSILAVANVNQPAELLLNKQGTSPVVAWGDVTAQNVFPITVGSERYGVWHQGNQGHGSGLDADTVDGLHATQVAYTPLIVVRDDSDTTTTWPPQPGIYEFVAIDMSLLPDTAESSFILPFFFKVENKTTASNNTEFSGRVIITYSKSGSSISVSSIKLFTDQDVYRFAVSARKNYFVFRPGHLRAKFDPTLNVVTIGAFLRNSTGTLRTNQKLAYIENSQIDTGQIVGLISEATATTKVLWDGNLDYEVSSLSTKSIIDIGRRKTNSVNIAESSTGSSITMEKYSYEGERYSIRSYPTNTFATISATSVLEGVYVNSTLAASVTKPATSSLISSVFTSDSFSIITMKDTGNATNAKAFLIQSLRIKNMFKIKIYEFGLNVADVFSYPGSGYYAPSSNNKSINKWYDKSLRISYTTNVSGEITQASFYRYSETISQFSTCELDNPVTPDKVRSSNADSTGSYTVLSGVSDQFNVTLPVVSTVSSTNNRTFSLVNTRSLLLGSTELSLVTYGAFSNATQDLTLYAYEKNSGTTYSYQFALSREFVLQGNRIFGNIYYDEVTDTPYFYISIPRNYLGHFIPTIPSGTIYPNTGLDVLIIINAKTKDAYRMEGDFSLGMPFSSWSLRYMFGALPTFKFFSLSSGDTSALIGVDLPTLPLFGPTKLHNFDIRYAVKVTPTINPAGVSISYLSQLPGVLTPEAQAENIAPTNVTTIYISASDVPSDI